MAPEETHAVSGASAPGTAPRPNFRERLASSIRSQGIGEYLFVAFTVTLGIVSILGAMSIGLSGSADTMGPRSFPLLVGILLIGSGVMVLVDLVRGRRGQADDGEDIDLSAKTDWVLVAKLVALFIVHSQLITVIGWWLAAAVLFIGAAWSLGAKKLVRLTVIGLTLALILQLAFGVGLGLSLPPGPLLDWIPLFRG